MLRLMLLRHAKSSWAEPGRSDKDRPLNRRGQQAASAVGRYLSSRGLTPHKVLYSPALRARQTWSLVREAAALSVEEECIDTLYTFDDGTALMEAIRARAGKSTCLMLIGHNPSMEALALALVGTGDATARDCFTRKYPTAGLAIIDFEAVGWGEIKAGAGHLVSFVRPRDLENL